MEQDIQKRFDAQDAKLEAIYKSVEKTRKYFLVLMWVTILAIVLPMIGLAFVIPSFLSNYTNSLGSLGI